MKIINLCLILSIVLIVSPFAVKATKKCSDIKEDAAKNACYVDEFRKLDKELNDKYKSIYKKLDSGSRSDLLYIQKNWIKYRNKSCQLEEITKKDKWIESIASHRRKIWCVGFKTKERIKKLAIYENRKLETDSSADVCTAIKKSMEANLYNEWFDARKIFYITKTYGYTANKKKKYGIFRSKDGNTIKVNPSTDTAWSGGIARLSPMFADLDGDGTDEIMVYFSLGRVEGMDYAIFKKNKGIYEPVTHEQQWYTPIYYNKKVYLIDDEIDPEVTIKGASRLLNYEVVTFCTVDVTYGNPVYKADCKNKRICQLVIKDNRLIKGKTFNVWDKNIKEIEKDNLPKELSIYADSSGFFWLDIDNDGVQDIAAVNYNLPYYMEDSPVYYKKADKEYRKTDMRRVWEKLPYGSTFIKSDGKKNYIIVRNHYGAEGSTTDKGNIFYIFFLKDKNLIKNGTVILTHPKEINIKR